MNSTSKFPTPTTGGRSNRASHDSPCVIKERRQLLGRQTISGVISSPWTQVAATGFDDLVAAKRYKSSKGERLLFIMLLTAAAPSHAAGVCIVCPPGHTCPTGSAPTLSGTPGQVLRRTTTSTEWVDIGLALNPLRDECNELRITAGFAEGLCMGRFCHCRIHENSWRNHMPQCPNSPVYARSFFVVDGPEGCTGSGPVNCWTYCRDTIHWRIQS